MCHPDETLIFSQVSLKTRACLMHIELKLSRTCVTSKNEEKKTSLDMLTCFKTLFSSTVDRKCAAAVCAGRHDECKQIKNRSSLNTSHVASNKIATSEWNCRTGKFHWYRYFPSKHKKHNNTTTAMPANLQLAMTSIELQLTEFPRHDRDQSFLSKAVK